MTHERLGLSIDPGMSTGMCLFSWNDETGFRRLWAKQVGGGAEGLSAMLWAIGLRIEPGNEYSMMEGVKLDALVVERFTPRQSDGFSLTRAAVEPLRGEGVLIGRGFGPLIEWAEPSQQYFIGNSALPLAEKKKLSRQFLKQHGLHLTGKDVNMADADDAISATLHAIAYLRRIRHRPTLVEMFGPAEA